MKVISVEWWLHAYSGLNIVHTLQQLVANGLLNTMRPEQNGRHFADDIMKCIFLYENCWILNESSLKFVRKGLINKLLIRPFRTNFSELSVINNFIAYYGVLYERFDGILLPDSAWPSAGIV